MRIPRRTLLQWLGSLLAYPACAQESPVGNKAAASDNGAVEHEISSAGLSLGLTRKGHILRLRLGTEKIAVPFHACTVLTACQPRDDVVRRALPDGGIEFTRVYSHEQTFAECTVTEKFFPTNSSIRWEVDVLGEAGRPWSTPIQTQLAWLNAAKATFWTAWDSPPGPATGWRDPLVLAAFADMDLRYGGKQSSPDAFCIPITTVFEESADLGLSLVQSPEDELLDMRLQTTSSGDIVLSRTNHRIWSRSPQHFSMDLVAHPADWRAGLGWMVRRYPHYFEPHNKAVHELDGCGAYSGYQGELDTDKLRKMAFSLNWNAHFDFPFHGMSIPSVAPDVSWNSWYQEPRSLARMNEYDAKMKHDGFHVLEYFVMTEGGNYIEEAAPNRKAKADQDLWRDANDFVHYQIPRAVMRDRQGNIRYSNWFRNVLLDPADPAWQKCLIEQIRSLVRNLRDSAGICIDRMDHLTAYNVNSDDGVSWVDGAPTRSILISWKQTMPKLAAILYEAGKHIFANTIVRRLDANEFVDGIYDEFADFPRMLNLAALLGVRKPTIGWTRDINTLRPDPDALFQQHLHLGVFPTVPFPGADHTISPDAWADQYYLDYGPRCLPPFAERDGS